MSTNTRNGSGVRVLIVDDEQELVETLQKRLRMRGFQVGTADSGETALDQLAEVRASSPHAQVAPETHVLLVDDEQELLRILGKRLRRRGYTVEAVADGDAALQRLAAPGEVDVVVLDVKMVGCSGLATLKSIKARHPEVEVIMLTGHGSVADALTAQRRGAMDYLTKPCDIDVLTDKLDQAKARRLEEVEP